MKCEHTHTMVTVGNWGPHRAKRICTDCGRWIKWESRKPFDQEQFIRMKQNRKMEVV